MRKNLKRILEELVEESVRSFNGKTFAPKRIVLFSSYKLKGDASTIIFNYLQNCFYNTQWHIDNRVPIEIMPYYNDERHRKEGDYIIDVGEFLIKHSIKLDDFLKT